MIETPIYILMGAELFQHDPQFYISLVTEA